jgi:hypothetical protein
METITTQRETFIPNALAVDEGEFAEALSADEVAAGIEQARRNIAHIPGNPATTLSDPAASSLLASHQMTMPALIQRLGSHAGRLEEQRVSDSYFQQLRGKAWSGKITKPELEALLGMVENDA